MEQLYTTKISKVGTSRAVIVPSHILNALGWQRGDRVVFTFAGDDQLIVKKLSEEQIRQIKNGKLGNESEEEAVIEYT